MPSPILNPPSNVPIDRSIPTDVSPTKRAPGAIQTHSEQRSVFYIQNGRPDHPLQASHPRAARDQRTEKLTALRSILFRNNFTMLGAVFASAFALQMSFDVGSQKLWDNMNRGRQWKDIKAKYVEGGAEDDDDE